MKKGPEGLSLSVEKMREHNRQWRGSLLPLGRCAAAQKSGERSIAEMIPAQPDVDQIPGCFGVSLNQSGSEKRLGI